jgi:hypothetical protein
LNLFYGGLLLLVLLMLFTKQRPAVAVVLAVFSMGGSMTIEGNQIHFGLAISLLILSVEGVYKLVDLSRNRGQGDGV